MWKKHLHFLKEIEVDVRQQKNNVKVLAKIRFLSFSSVDEKPNKSTESCQLCIRFNTQPDTIFAA